RLSISSMTASDIGFERLRSARSETRESQRSTHAERSEGARTVARRGAADAMAALSAGEPLVFTPWGTLSDEEARRSRWVRPRALSGAYLERMTRADLRHRARECPSCRRAVYLNREGCYRRHFAT